MTNAQADRSGLEMPLRLWPGVAAVLVQWLFRFAVPMVAPEDGIFGMEAGVIGVIAGLVCGLAVLVWWAFFSRAPRFERWGGVILMIAAMVATPRIVHESIQGGMMGMMFFIYAIPTLSLAFVAWAVVARHLSKGPRRAAMIAAIVLGCGVWALVRTNGLLGGGSDLQWRWTPTAEERLLARGGDTPPAPPAAPAAAETGAAWPGFRGAHRDGVVRGVRIATDWTASPPVALWRRPIGPGWSSFAVRGELVYTQEQRGEDEIVACYNLTTGEPVWMHRDAARFWESNAGAGPRGTPTLGHGRVYALGATGILNALDAGTGAVVWSRNAATDTKVKVPGWGFASSPLVIDDVVIVATSGALAAYDAATGAPRWSRESGGGSYSSPHLVTIDGVDQVLLLNGAGVASLAPADGAVLWQNAWAGIPMVQPALIAGGDLLTTTSGASGGLGMRRITAAHAPAGWTVEERWTSIGLKPYFNDYVVHEGHAYGFDGAILACIDLEDGSRKWKGGRFGNGQLVLLPDQDLMLVVSEEGELALVGATPDRFTELARLPGVEGKTWNHPALVGDILLVRNDQEMAAFRLAPASS